MKPVKRKDEERLEATSRPAASAPTAHASRRVHRPSQPAVRGHAGAAGHPLPRGKDSNRDGVRTACPAGTVHQVARRPRAPRRGVGGGQPTDARAESRPEHPLAGAKGDRKARHVSGSRAPHPGRPPRGSAQGHGGRGLCHRQGKHTTQKVATRTREHTALGAHGGESEEPVVSTSAFGTGETTDSGTRKAEAN